MSPQAILPGLPDAADVVVALVHRRQQLADFLRRILQIGVQRHHPLAPAILEAGHDRHVLAVIGVEQDDPRDVGPGQELVFQQRRRAVAAAVVDEQHFVGYPQCVQRRIEPREQRGQRFLFVVDGNDDRELGIVHANTSLTAAHTRSTSARVIVGNSGSVTVSRAMRSVFGNSPS